MSVLQAILQDQNIPESPLLITPAEKLLWDGIVQKDIEKVESSIKMNNGVPFLAYDLLRVCVDFFDSQICEIFFPKDQVHPLDEDDVLLLLQSEETTRFFLPSLVALSNKLIAEKGYFNNSNFGRIFYWAGENLTLVLQDPKCQVIQNLQKSGEEKGFVKWVIRSCQPSMLEVSNVDWSNFSTDLEYTLPRFETLKELYYCQQLWGQQTPAHQKMIQKILAPMHDLFPQSLGGDPWITAYILHNTHIMSEMLSSVEGCKYLQKMLEVSQQLGCCEKIIDRLIQTMRFEIHLEEKMDFEKYAQFFKIFAKYTGSQNEVFGVKMLLNVYAFHEKWVREDQFQDEYENSDDEDDAEEERRKGAYEDTDFFILLRTAVYQCEDEVVKIMDRYSKSWKAKAQKMIYEKHLNGLGCENTKKKM